LNSRLRSPCQICKREGHQTLNCFNLMNYSFQGRHPPTKLAVMVVEVNTTYLNQHQWYADNGANIHVTSDIANLSTSQPYEGDDSVRIGNGTSFIISYLLINFVRIIMFTLNSLVLIFLWRTS
jgi:hypothetical protein